MRKVFAVILAVALLVLYCLPAMAAEVEIAGAIQAEAGFTEYDDGGKSVKEEDITATTVELGAFARVNERTDAHIILLFEEDETEPIAVDSAFIVYRPMEGLFVQAGLYVVPFGSYDTLLISDPLTLELGETGQSAVAVGYESGPITAQVGTFNGDVWENGDEEEKIDVYFAALDYSTGEDPDMPISAGVSWISSIAESDVLQEMVSNSPAYPDSAVVNSAVAGIAAYVTASIGPVNLIAEYVTAAGEFKADDFGTTKDIKPSAYNLEVGTDINESTSVAARYGGTKDMEELEAFETVTALAVSHELEEGTSVSAEYFVGKHYDEADLDDTTALVFQLAVEF